jgi:hypothetical protein
MVAPEIKKYDSESGNSSVILDYTGKNPHEGEHTDAVVPEDKLFELRLRTNPLRATIAKVICSNGKVVLQDLTTTEAKRSKLYIALLPQDIATGENDAYKITDVTDQLVNPTDFPQPETYRQTLEKFGSRESHRRLAHEFLDTRTINLMLGRERILESLNGRLAALSK